MSRFGRALRRLTVDEGQLEREELQGLSHEVGATAVSECRLGERACVAGVVRSVTQRPRSGAPALEAELYDGSAPLLVVWLGRRRIAGIEAGAQVVVHGRVARSRGQRIMWNPRYELRPTGPERD